MRRLQVIIPMAGTGGRFLQAGYRDPKPLIDVAGRPAVARLLENFPREWKFVFICKEEDLRDTLLEQVLKACVPEAAVIGIAAHKRGPVHTLVAAAAHIADDMPTIVNYCDFSFSWNAAAFDAFVQDSSCSGAVLCYRGFHPHYVGDTLYAYCREKDGRIQEIREKASFTDDVTREFASSGSYYFASGALAKKYLRMNLERGPDVDGEYYVSLAYNPMIAEGLDVRIYEIPFFLQWGTPQDLEEYLYWHRVFERRVLWRAPDRSRAPRLVMPMGGRGARFGADFPPKPLIPVHDQPMFLAARELLPARRETPVFVVRSGLEEAVRGALADAVIVTAKEPEEGQAATTWDGLQALDPSEPVLVSACDHGLLWDQAGWERMLEDGPDLIVVGQRGYPGARRTPQDFSYIRTGDSGRVSGVSLKDPAGGDLVLVGTFYFSSAALLGELIKELRDNGLRVNGEFYLDAVVGLALQRGLDVRCFEAQAYLNWGSPEALNVYAYWQRYFDA